MEQNRDTNKQSSRRPEPVDIYVSVRVNFASTAEEAVQLMESRHFRFAGNVFYYRDRILRFLLVNTIRAASKRPRVYSQLLPGLEALNLLRKRPPWRRRAS